MSEAEKMRLIHEAVAAAVEKVNVTADLSLHEHETMDPEVLRQKVARRPEEPAPLGYEHFEHCREEGA